MTLTDVSAVRVIVPPVPIQAPAIDQEPRCWRCRRLLAILASRPWEIDCSRCKAKNCSGLGLAAEQMNGRLR